jgi:hypothetical protein
LTKRYALRALTYQSHARFTTRKKAEILAGIPHFVLKSHIFWSGLLAGVALASRLPRRERLPLPQIGGA